MNVLRVYLGLYATCVARAAKGVRRNPWTLLLPAAMAVAWQWIRYFTAIPFLGAIVLSGFFSCYLYFLGECVHGSPVSLRELRVSVTRFIWPVLAVLFVLWVAGLLLGAVLARNPNAPFIYRCIRLACFVLLNAVPEVLYLRGIYGGLATAEHSLRFIQENWIEWFAPNLPLLALAWFGVDIIGLLLSIQLSPNLVVLLVVGVGGALFHFYMVFRGCLFEELATSSHRQRMYRQRMGG